MVLLASCHREPGLLWLGFTLLGALHTQARSSTPRLLRAPPLSRIPLQPNFQADQFQGKWYTVGVAGNAIKKEEQDQFKMYTSNYELKEDGSYNVTSILLRDERCDYWIRTFVPSSRPGQFTLGNIRSFPGIRSYTVRVVNTDYNQFAIVYFKKVQRKQGYFKITLYGGSFPRDPGDPPSPSPPGPLRFRRGPLQFSSEPLPGSGGGPGREALLQTLHEEGIRGLVHTFSNVYRVFAGRPPATLTTGRTKELTPEVRENFITFAKSLGLTDDHIIFPVPIAGAGAPPYRHQEPPPCLFFHLQDQRLERRGSEETQASPPSDLHTHRVTFWNCANPG
ncbi:hypothetical protein MJT46_003437 [Ovis ammon polii x Ovis aries]|nr:hypothetical protein MJT46_003437 [Ovis ammon polii x Ovis aries]